MSATVSTPSFGPCGCLVDCEVGCCTLSGCCPLQRSTLSFTSSLTKLVATRPTGGAQGVGGREDRLSPVFSFLATPCPWLAVLHPPFLCVNLDGVPHINNMTGACGMTDLELSMVTFPNRKYLLIWEIVVHVCALKLNNETSQTLLLRSCMAVPTDFWCCASHAVRTGRRPGGSQVTNPLCFVASW